MSPIDTNDAQSVTPNTPPVSNTADNAAPAPTPQPSPVAPQPIPANTASGVSAQPQTSPAQSSSQQPPPSQTQMVSNPVQHPAVQRASLLRDVAQALAGGPRVQTTIDPTTGATTRTQIPLSGRDIGLAIALEAISGSLTGLSQIGPNAAARAGAAAFAQSEQRTQQQRVAQEAQALQDSDNQAKALARSASIANTNLQTHQNALRLGQMEYEAHKQYVSDAAPVLDSLNQVGAIKAQGVHESDLLPAYHVAKDMAVVDGIVPRLNADGTQAKNPDGSLAWDNTYSVIDPDARITMPAATARLLSEYRVPGYFKVQDGKSVPIDIPQNFPIRARMVVDGLATASAIRITEGSINQQLKALEKDGDAEAHQFELNLKDALADGSLTPKALRTFARYGTQPIDLALSAMQRDKVDADTMGQIASLLPADSLEQLKQRRVAAEEKAKRDADAAAEVEKQKALIPIRAQTAGAEERARQNAKPHVTSESLTQPDALGNIPTVTDPKEASKRFASFKRNLDSLAQTESTYEQFQQIASDVASGKLTGPESVVALLAAVGISAAPLKGNGFRISREILAEHKNARGWEESMQQKFLGAKDGDILTPGQILGYSNIAANARVSQHVNLANQMRAAGLSTDPALPVGNGRKLDSSTAQIFFQLANRDANRARQAAIAKGWVVQ